MTDDKKQQLPTLEIDLRWSGTDDVPAFHETRTEEFADPRAGYSELLATCSDAIEGAIEKALTAERQRKRTHELLANLSEESGLDIPAMAIFYGCDTPGELIREMQGHIKQLIARTNEPQVNHHPVKPPRAG
jgi:hypothetical protein